MQEMIHLQDRRSGENRTELIIHYRVSDGFASGARRAIIYEKEFFQYPGSSNQLPVSSIILLILSIPP
jgi:hypothetical protein